MITNATPTGFINDLSQPGAEFLSGVRVVGTDIVYDDEGLPISGTITEIAVFNEGFTVTNPRDPDGPNDVARYSDLNVKVEDLIFLSPDWYSPNFFFDLADVLVELGYDAPDTTVNSDAIPFLGTLQTGAGNDTIRGSFGEDVIRVGAGDDRVFAGDSRDVVFGGDGDDFLGGGAGQDFLYGEDGNDTLMGNVGNDIMQGGAGNDGLFGQDGDDSMIANSGDDKLFGGAGNDTLLVRNFDSEGGDGNNRLNGGSGRDLLVGGDGNDVLLGGGGRDTLISGGGTDVLKGGSGDDVLVAVDFYSDGDGPDSLKGGTGADIFMFYEGIYNANSVVVDFNVDEDILVTVQREDTTAQDQYDLFLEGAVQDGDDVVWTDTTGNSIGRIENLDLDDLSVDNFMDDFGRDELL